MGKIFLIVIVFAGAIWGAMVLSKQKPELNTGRSNSVMQITSSAFVNNGRIPEKYTCSGENINPPLSFSGIPADTQSLALILDDPDAPTGTFTHWVVYGMPSSTKGIDGASVPPGNVARNSAGIKNYMGPCPPSGEHRYFFKLYALDIQVQSAYDKKQLQEAMSGHILSEAELMGKFSKTN